MSSFLSVEDLVKITHRISEFSPGSVLSTIEDEEEGYVKVLFDLMLEQNIIRSEKVVRNVLLERYPKEKYGIGIEPICSRGHSAAFLVRIWKKNLEGIDVSLLSSSSVLTTPILADFRTLRDSSVYGYGRCGCGFVHNVDHDVEHYKKSIESRCYGLIPSVRPRLNSIYPLPGTVYENRIIPLAKSLAGTGFGIVVVHSGTPLVGMFLSDIGYDYSWEICRAYIVCGYLPPIHFYRLSLTENYRNHPDSDLIIEAMERSNSIAEQVVVNSKINTKATKNWMERGKS